VTVTTAPDRAETAANEQPASAPRMSDTTWERRYARRLIVTDLLVVVWAVAGAQIARFGLDPAPAIADSRRHELELATSYTALSLILIPAWMLVLAAFGTRDSRVVGVGAAEYKRIFDASLRLFGLVAIVAFLLKVDVARSYVLLALPTGVVALLLTRWIWRHWLTWKRGSGEFSSRVLLLGSTESVVATARDLMRMPSAGYHLVAAITTDKSATRHLLGTTIPLSNAVKRVAESMAEHTADTLIITSSGELTSQRIRELSWGLEPGRQHLVVAPSLTDVSGPRIHVRPVAGLPLMHVETPRYDGVKAFTKRAFDILVSGLLIIVFSPLLVLLAMAVRLSSAGPILYRSERVGFSGEPFSMLKFRSMRVGADLELGSLLAQQGTDDKPLFKVRNDPRITPLGRVLRKYSLDELPQLFNVLLGTMSLVGPRPQIAAEVALYDDAAARRLLLKPGVSGLWQISGRSSLSWEDAIRLDVYYVEI
jgi:exopolysaccharide biosynthesis polyprenyl glycosylphosphotransferase